MPRSLWCISIRFGLLGGRLVTLYLSENERFSTLVLNMSDSRCLYFRTSEMICTWIAYRDGRALPVFGHLYARKLNRGSCTLHRVARYVAAQITSDGLQLATLSGWGLSSMAKHSSNNARARMTASASILLYLSLIIVKAP